MVRNECVKSFEPAKTYLCNERKELENKDELVY
jgi:hypothetical protein